jgi:hypothetical protein
MQQTNPSNEFLVIRACARPYEMIKVMAKHNVKNPKTNVDMTQLYGTILKHIYDWLIANNYDADAVWQIVKGAE